MGQFLNTEMDLVGEQCIPQLKNVKNSGPDYLALNDDPQLLYKLKEPLPVGWQHAILKISGDYIINPKLYIDIGHGFNEIHKIRLKPTLDPFVFEARFYLPLSAYQIRLDPSDIKTPFRIEFAKFMTIGKFSSAIFLIGHGAKLLSVRPKQFLQRSSRYLKFLFNPDFLDVNQIRKKLTNSNQYENWILNSDYSADRDRGWLTKHIDHAKKKPLISIVMSVSNVPVQYLRDSIGSVLLQVYENWELRIAYDASSGPDVVSCLKHWSELDNRIKVVQCGNSGNISRSCTSVLELCRGKWTARLDSDAILRENALAEVVLEINHHSDAKIIYSDEDEIDSNNRYRSNPHFKPEFSREMLRSFNYFGQLSVYKTDFVRRVGGWRPGFDGSEDYDLILRIFELISNQNIIHIPKILYHKRTVGHEKTGAIPEKQKACPAGLKALGEHVERIGLDARAVPAPDTTAYRLLLSAPNPEPLVSLIIPTRDKVELLKGSIESICSKTTYKNYEILVIDNRSSENETLNYLNRINETEKIRVLRFDEPFNYSAINNFAVESAKGSILGLVNNDVEVISPNWLSEMVSWALIQDIGCVGAKLYYPDDTVQHGGVICGIGGVAGHSHRNFPRNHSGYFNRLKVIQNLSAVTGACLIVRKEVYLKVGGLNELKLPVAFNDVDFCLKTLVAGYNNVWTPYAELYHLESPSRGMDDTPEKMARFQREIEYMTSYWGETLQSDNFYSPHLSKLAEDFSIAS